jgi:tetratricopeptide (TPR) repeat protein
VFLLSAPAFATGLPSLGVGDSARMYDDAFRRLPSSQEGTIQRALADYSSGRWEGAISNFTEAIHMGTSNALVFSGRGAAYLMITNWDAAINDLGRAIQLNKEDITPYLYRGCARRGKGQLQQAIEDFSRYLEAAPTNDFAYKSRASAYNGLGQFAKAIHDWNEGLRLAPTDATALAMRGYAYLMTGQFDQALRDFKQALHIEPGNDKALNNLAWLRAACPTASMRNGTEAVKSAKQACEQTHWTRWEWVDTLAAANAEAGKFRDAVKYEAQAMAMKGVSQKDREAMQHRLLLYQKRQPYRLDVGKVAAP